MGWKHTEESKEKIRKAHLGKKRAPFTKEWSIKLGLAHKGRKQTAEWVKKRTESRRGYTPTVETIEKMRLTKTGKKWSPLQREVMMASIKSRPKRVSPLKGRKLSLERRLAMSERHRGENGTNWQGGKTKKNAVIRASLKYRLWRKSVYERDKYTCVWCGQIGGSLHADHIKPFAYFPKLRFRLDNGRTLCVPCHKKTDTYLKKLPNGEKLETYKQ